VNHANLVARVASSRSHSTNAELDEGTPSTPVSPKGRLREIERELRQSLRGLTPDALVKTLALSREELHSALDAAISTGRVVRRGPRYFAS
jgi:hypothetical protein